MLYSQMGAARSLMHRCQEDHLLLTERYTHTLEQTLAVRNNGTHLEPRSRQMDSQRQQADS